MKFGQVEGEERRVVVGGVDFKGGITSLRSSGIEFVCHNKKGG